MERRLLFTVGHSNRSIEEFIELLRFSDVSAVADVRSHPYSHRLPHFNRESISERLHDAGIAYVFLGEELGARRSESGCYVDGRAEYDLIEQTPLFQSGLDRVRQGAERYRVALMCAEMDPVTCHRSVLIAKALRSEFEIRHIVSRDEIESHDEAERRLLRIWRLDHRDLFQNEAELLDDAYRRQAAEIAYVAKDLVATQNVIRTND